MRVLAFCCAALVLCLAVAGVRDRVLTASADPWQAIDGPVPSARTMVVAELFTSEGCSSCPPADAVLSRLVREPLGNTVVLGLGEHVDYWDGLGWRDPFSSPAFSSRQAEYQQQVFRTASVYTPQLVIDGQFEAVGSDVKAVHRAIANAARIPKAAVEVVASPAANGQLSVHVRIDISSAALVRERADVIVALTRDHASSDVRRGENRGRTLTHSAVVQGLTALGSVNPPLGTFDQTVTLPLPRAVNIDDVRVIGLLQERRSRRIVGAGSAPVMARQAAHASS